MVAMGVLNTLDTLVTVLEEQRELVAMLEPTLLQLLVGQVLGQSLLEFYEEALSLLYSLPAGALSRPTCGRPLRPSTLPSRKTPSTSSLHFLTTLGGSGGGMTEATCVDMMPALHNFVTVDTPGFVSNENHLLAMYNMCKAQPAGMVMDGGDCDLQVETGGSC
ncbi:hypothetical protein HPB52_002097 [Rhipicephalus sanguineus]|uniref:Uncharacterized protein n=1 Tax=Rhipicephalus sanguineus TaxID=34632 RepID=A0A9D4Q4A9_RHISA|nr:hypothetical protein HPB52_002097 [Rhipicephalus sanguineus]